MLQELLATEIFLPHQVTENEASYLVKQAECAELALTRFVAGDISFGDYCDILELCDVDIDEYFTTVENNLQIIGV